MLVTSIHKSQLLLHTAPLYNPYSVRSLPTIHSEWWWWRLNYYWRELMIPRIKLSFSLFSVSQTSSLSSSVCLTDSFSTLHPARSRCIDRGPHNHTASTYHNSMHTHTHSPTPHSSSSSCPNSDRSDPASNQLARGGGQVVDDFLGAVPLRRPALPPPSAMFSPAVRQDTQPHPLRDLVLWFLNTF